MQVPLLKQRLIDSGVSHTLVHTGQHYDPILAAELMREIGLGEPDINLGVGSGSHANQTAQIMIRLEAALAEIKPDFVIVDGDTNSTLATSLVTSKLRIPLLHVEAGIRDNDRDRPEEINRILTDHASELNVAPIPRALENLKYEGLGERSELAGDLLLDNFLHFLPKANPRVRSELGLNEGAYNLITLHRPENTTVEKSERFDTILRFIADLDLPAVFPCHPRVLKQIDRVRDQSWARKIHFLPAVSYLEMLDLLRGAHTVFTDSGGLSREAAWIGARTLMFFKVDTWHDLLDRGWAQVAKGDRSTMEQAYARLIPAPPIASQALFGSGKAADRIVSILRNRNWI